MRFADKFVQDFSTGQAVFKEGEPGDNMYFVLSGSVHIVKQGVGGPRHLAQLSEGEMFGEMALVDSGVRMADALAGPEGAKVVCIDQARFVYLVSQQPAFALSVMRVMAKRLSQPARA